MPTLKASIGNIAKMNHESVPFPQEYDEIGTKYLNRSY